MIKNYVKSILFLVFISIIFINISIFFIPKELNRDKWNMFYKIPNETIDIVFLGSSHSHRTHVPMIYNEILKVDSISIGTAGATIEQIYFQLQEILKTQSPKVVVIEMFSLADYIEEQKIGTVHKAFDTMKISKNKINAIEYNIYDESKSGFYFPILSYHQRWKIIYETLLKKNLNPYYGYVPSDVISYKTVNEFLVTPNEMTNEKIYLSEKRLILLDEITKLCNENNIKIIYFVAPYITQKDLHVTELHKHINGLENYTNINNIDIVDFSVNPAAIDIFRDDLFNDGHVNIGGAHKISLALVDYISLNYAELFVSCSYDFREESENKYFQYLNELEIFIEGKEEYINFSN